jgi:type IV pilus assembly protein PilC
MDKITSFRWTGINAKGAPVKGETEALSAAHLKTVLHNQGIRVRSIKSASNWMAVLNKKSIKTREIVIFTRQLATMINASVPIVQALLIITKSIPNKTFQKILNKIRADIQAGSKFSDALSQYPECFTPFFCSLVLIGEESGNLAGVLDSIAIHQEKNAALKNKIKKALFYPIVVVIVAFGVAAILLIKVVPQFATLFASFNAKLPAFTLFVISISNFVLRYALLIAILIGGMVSLFIFLKRHSVVFQHALDRFVLRLPIFGPLIQKGIVARFSSTLATTFKAGLPLIEALKLVAKTADNSVYENKFLVIREAVKIGEPLHSAIEATHLFDPLVTQMILIGEETGKLDEMLHKIASIYEDEVETMLGGLSSLLEPLIISFIGILVGGLVIAMYLPIFKLGSVV